MPDPASSILRFALTAMATVLVVLLPGCADHDPLTIHAPDLTPEYRRLLAIEDLDDFEDAAAELGEPRLKTLWNNLMSAVPVDPEAFPHVEPHAERIAGVFRDRFDTRLFDVELKNLRSTRPEHLARLHRIYGEQAELITDPVIPDSLKIHRLNDLAREVMSLRRDGTAVEILSSLGREYARTGDRESSIRSYETALAQSRDKDDPWMICQCLGTLAELRFQAGQRDTAMAYLDLAEARARRSKLANQSARILSFRASYARSSGDFGAAHLLMQEARAVCREFKGGSLQARFFLEEADLLEQLGCWRLSLSLMEEAMIVFDLPSYEVETTWLPVRRILMKLAHARSLYEFDADEGLKEFGRALAGLNPRPWSEHFAHRHLQYADMLLRAGRVDAASRVARKGLDQSEADHLPRHHARFELVLSRAAMAAGDVGAARSRLDAYFADRGGSVFRNIQDLATAAALDIRLAALEHGDGPELAAAVDGAFGLMDEALSRTTPSVADYLALSVFNEVRWAVHEILADDPVLGYEFDMNWRLLARHPSASGLSISETTPVLRTAGSCRKTCCEAGVAARSRGSAEADHLLYLVGDTHVVRWHVKDGAVARTVLEVTHAELEVLVMAVSAAMSTPPGGREATIPEALLRDLERLASHLLPASFFESPPARLLVSGDDMLELLPFGTLMIDGRPLGLTTDLMRLRYDCNPPLERAGRFVVVTNPDIPSEMRRLHPGLVDLPGTEHEGREAVEHWPDVELLTGGDATKPSVLHALSEAAVFYSAAHVMQSAQAPFLKFMPLSGDGDGAIEQAVLGMNDVLACDLSACQLVVLTGCSTGSPYVTGTRLAPGFGDVFLDAGARGALQSLWRVDDATMGPLMESIISDYVPGEDLWELAAAVRRAKIRMYGDDEAGRHPYHWGGLTLVSSGP